MSHAYNRREHKSSEHIKGLSKRHHFYQSKSLDKCSRPPSMIEIGINPNEVSGGILGSNNSAMYGSPNKNNATFNNPYFCPLYRDSCNDYHTDNLNRNYSRAQDRPICAEENDAEELNDLPKMSIHEDDLSKCNSMRAQSSHCIDPLDATNSSLSRSRRRSLATYPTDATHFSIDDSFDEMCRNASRRNILETYEDPLDATNDSLSRSRSRSRSHAREDNEMGRSCGRNEGGIYGDDEPHTRCIRAESRENNFPEINESCPHQVFDDDLDTSLSSSRRRGVSTRISSFDDETLSTIDNNFNFVAGNSKHKSRMNHVDSSKSEIETVDCQSRRTVRFSHVSIRSHDRILGDNPSCSNGPSVSIGWNYEEELNQCPIDEFECVREYFRRGSHGMILSRSEREMMLLELGYSTIDIANAVRMSIRVKNQRRRTLNNLKYAKVEEAVENIGGKIKAMIKLKKMKREKKEENLRHWNTTYPGRQKWNVSNPEDGSKPNVPNPEEGSNLREDATHVLTICTGSSGARSDSNEAKNVLTSSSMHSFSTVSMGGDKSKISKSLSTGDIICLFV